MDGTLRARVKFGAFDARTVFELCLFHDRDRKHMVSFGLGGDGYAYSIREYAPSQAADASGSGNKWTHHKTEGLASYIQAGREYLLEVRLQGGRATLLVDDVAVIAAHVPALQGGPRQLGAFFIGHRLTEVWAVEVLQLKPRVFIVMQLDGAYDELYQHVIRNVCDEFDMLPSRADDLVGPTVIMEDIVREIDASRLVVADITPANLNVYYEIGYARALRKPVILLAQKGTKLPFDVAGFRVLFYENTIGGKARLDDNLRKHVLDVLK